MGRKYRRETGGRRVFPGQGIAGAKVKRQEMDWYLWRTYNAAEVNTPADTSFLLTCFTFLDENAYQRYQPGTSAT